MKEGEALKLNSTAQTMRVTRRVAAGFRCAGHTLPDARMRGEQTTDRHRRSKSLM
ncbi:hypothetical protein ACFOLF_27910 [Paenibacillus sepulcri]|uniref:Uncharacterized protein n=1 Tax=Paenibacillus sepulcri TaxID=359917 RepID=A0ABS7C5H8_9BACL|nr:hypothetical protein [Paenibacillus sepulcri]